MSREYATHLPVLRRLVRHIMPTKIIEYGGGLYSTRFFLRLPIKELWTVETDDYWATEVATNDKRHWVSSSAPKDADLILVDDGLTVYDRSKTIRQVSADRPQGLVVVHDVENVEYRDAADFDHCAVFSRLTPWTGVMWNEDSRHGGGWIHRLASG